MCANNSETLKSITKVHFKENYSSLLQRYQQWYWTREKKDPDLLKNTRIFTGNIKNNNN